MSFADFYHAAIEWLLSAAEPRPDASAWGTGSDDVAIFPEWDFEEEQAQFADARAWLRRRYEAGFGGIAYPVALGGQGLTRGHDLVYQLAEGGFVTPSSEIWSITFGMVLPTIAAAGSAAQQERFLVPGFRGELLYCQMFSEPDAGSDLSAIRTFARQDGAQWVVNGSKVWTSMARGSDYALLLARTAADAPTREAFTMFLLPMESAGVTVRPIRQMTGGATFNEISLVDVVVADELRLGDVGAGWATMLTTLQNERIALPLAGPAGSVDRLVALATHRGVIEDPQVRDDLVRLHIQRRLLDLNALRSLAAVDAGADPGPEGSIGKLLATGLLSDMARFTSTVLGTDLIADSGEWGTFAWTSHMMGAIGLHIGGGTDEIVKNMIAERVLGLPRSPRARTERSSIS